MALEELKMFFHKMYDSTKSNDSTCQSHFYSNEYYSVKDGITRSGRNLKFLVQSIDDHYHEMLLVNGKISAIFVITSISYYETAIDIKVVVKQLIPTGKAKRLVKAFYEELNSHLSLKKVGKEANEFE